MKIRKLMLILGACICIPMVTNASSNQLDKNTEECGIINTIESVEDLNYEIIETNIENDGVSLDKPVIEEQNLLLRGLSKPSTSNVVNLKNGQMNFSGSASVSDLYTNSFFKGKSKIEYKVVNDSSKKLTVYIHRNDSIFSVKALTFNGNSKTTGTVSGLDASKLYYLIFTAPSDFSGYVK